MFKNYIKIALRNLARNSLYSFINIFGLAVGLASTLLIMLWVYDEITYDGFHQNKESLYKVYGNFIEDGGKIHSSRALPLPLAEELKTNEKDIEYVAVTDWGSNHLLTAGEKRFIKSGYYAGEDFLKMFSFKLLQGSDALALKDPSGIVLTRAAAIALFGTEDVLGKTVRVDNLTDAMVSAVVENVPPNSTFQFEYLLPFSSYITSQDWVKNSLSNWDNVAFQVYVQLVPHTSREAVESRVKDLIKRHSKASQTEIFFHPMAKWRLWSKFEDGKSVGGAIEQVRMFSLIALFTLLIACINFMNLSTARSERRAKEVGIRKTVGSRRSELLFQFLGESIVAVAIAYCIGLSIAEISLPFYNDLTGKKLSIDLANPLFLIASVVVIVVTGFIAGSYPAFYISAFNPFSVLKGRAQMIGKGTILRKTMVVTQFCFSMLLISATLVFNQQIQYGKDREIGYDRENLLVVEKQGDIARKFEAIKNDLLSKGLASNVTQANNPVTEITSYMGSVSWPGKRESQKAPLATVATAYNYTSTVGVKLKAGRDFSQEFNDSLSIMLNQAAVDYMELKNPLEETIILSDKKHKIIGVTENVLMGGAYKPVEPMIFIFDPGWFDYAIIRLPKGNVSNNLKRIEEVFKIHNPAYPFTYQFADSEFEKKFSSIQLISRVADMFALLAIIISCLGLFGLAAFTAEQRTKEIGIRKVLGASVTSVMLLLSKDFSKLVVIAFVIATPLAWWGLSQWLESYPYRVAIQWQIFGVAGALSFLLAIATVTSQSIRAAVSNPVESLKNE